MSKRTRIKTAAQAAHRRRRHEFRTALAQAKKEASGKPAAAAAPKAARPAPAAKPAAPAPAAKPAAPATPAASTTTPKT
jgi:translation initiation factor IF-2